MIKNILCLNLVKKDNKPTLEIIKDINDNISYDFIFLTDGFGVHRANEIIRSLNTGLEIKFKNFRQYSKLINDLNTLNKSSCLNTPKTTFKRNSLGGKDHGTL